MVACARKLAAEHDGHFPENEAELQQLPGIGRYTAAAIAAIAFGRRAVVVDANVERVVARLFAVKEMLPAARGAIYDLAGSITPESRSGDFAQAMMDLGSMVCTPRSPDCPNCPLSMACIARSEGNPEAYPKKAVKQPRPQRRGHAYWLQHRDHVLLVRRPEKGLLGGMLAFPSGAWEGSPIAGEGAPTRANWQEVGEIDHVFTHFSLKLRLFCAQSEERSAGDIWWPIDRLADAGLPTVFAKLAVRGVGWSAAA
jgi:A/G-specific adenine glycosylase